MQPDSWPIGRSAAPASPAKAKRSLPGR
jgi:hypothetical protein